MQLWKKMSELTVDRFLRLGKNAVIKKVNANGTESTIDLTELAVLDGLTATAAEINAVADVSAIYETVTAANVIAASETGKTFFLNHATGFASTLPAPALGLKFTFIVKTAPTSGNHTVKTNGDANVIHGQITTGEDGAGSVTTAAAADIVNFVANKAIVGDRLDVVSDGTNWYITGFCAVQDGMTTVQTA